MPPATLPLHPAPIPARPLFSTETYYAELAREALDAFELAVQLPIPGLADHRPNLPGFPVADTISYLRSAMTRYATVSGNAFQDMFDWEHEDAFFPEGEEKHALEWADGLIGHLIDRWGWRHLLASQESMIGDWRPEVGFRMIALCEAFDASRPTLTIDEHEAIGHIAPTLRAMLARLAPGGPREIDGRRAMFSGPMVAYLQSVRENDEEDEFDAA